MKTLHCQITGIYRSVLAVDKFGSGIECSQFDDPLDEAILPIDFWDTVNLLAHGLFFWHKNSKN